MTKHNKEIINSGIYITELKLNGGLVLGSLFSSNRQGQNVFFPLNYAGKKCMHLSLTQVMEELITVPTKGQ